MRLPILALVCSLSVLVFATGKLEDKDNIRDLFSAYALAFDEKKFDKFGSIFTRDATFEAKGEDPIKGVTAIAKYLEAFVSRNVTTFTEISTILIKFVPPLDREGRSDRAEALSYAGITIFSGGNSTKVFFLPLKFTDREIVRTKERGFGGWRIEKRKAEVDVSFPSTSHKIVVPPITIIIIIIIIIPSSFCFQTVCYCTFLLIQVIFRDEVSETPTF